MLYKSCQFEPHLTLFKKNQSLSLAVARRIVPNKEACKKMTSNDIGLKEKYVLVQTTVLF